MSWLGFASAAGMLLVLVMGATVTSTGSAEGCGRSWPLCQGRFVPEFAVATAIEFSHRAVTGAEGVLVVAFTTAVLARYGRQRPAQILGLLMLGSLLLQAGMGAWAVMSPQQPVVLALHFGISLVALASTTLTALYVRHPDAMGTEPAAPSRLRLATWGTLGYLYLLIYSGAYIRHAAVAAACPGWPLCGATPAVFGPDAAAVNLVHRLGAGTAVALAAGLLLLYRRQPGRRDLRVGGLWLVVALLAQAGAGAVMVLSGWSLFSELLHAALTGVIFTAAAYLCLRVTLGHRPAEVATGPGPQGRLSPEGASRA